MNPAARIASICSRAWALPAILARRLSGTGYSQAAFELEKLNEFAVSLLQQNTLEDLLWNMAQNVGELLGYEDCVIYLVDGERIVQAAAYGIKNPADRNIMNPITIPIGEGVTGTVAKTGVAELVMDTSRDSRYIADEFSGKSELAVPIILEGQVIGVLDTESSQPHGYGDDDKRMLQSIANIAATRIGRAIADRDRTWAEEALKKAHAQLEKRVQERTAQLSDAVKELQLEVAERRRIEGALAEEKETLGATLRSMGEGVIATDLDGRIVLMSDVAEFLVDCQPHEGVGRFIGDVVQVCRAEEGGEVLDILGDALQGTVERVPQGWMRRSDGSVRIVASTAVPIRGSDVIVGAVVVLRDMTHERHLESEAAKAQRFEALGVLAGGIAHDFNNLMMVILGNVNLAQSMSGDDDRLDAALGLAERACLQSKGLTKQLLAFSKGGAPIKKTRSMSEILKQTLRFSLRGSSVAYDLDIVEDLRPVDVDVGQVNQVMNNLFLNAVQAMPEGGRILVRAWNQVGSGRSDRSEGLSGVRICVSDTGKGISDEDLARIFDPYFTTKQGGVGLGLATSYWIVKRHQGVMWADSSLGAGTSFHIWLPESENALIDDVPQEAKYVEEPAKILVMDDDDQVRSSVLRILETFGHRAVAARDGEQAIQLFVTAREAGEPFDVVIMDLTIPGGMGGREAIAKLRRIAPDVRAIVASGYFDDPVMSNYREHGFVAVIEKPFQMAELGNVIADVLNVDESQTQASPDLRIVKRG